MTRALITTLLALGLAGCGSSAPCENAAALLRDCVAQLNCNIVGPTERIPCMNGRTSAESTAQALEDNASTCIAGLETQAKNIEACRPQPGTFCQCN